MPITVKSMLSRFAIARPIPDAAPDTTANSFLI
jgi:hypothetical protein